MVIISRVLLVVLAFMLAYCCAGQKPIPVNDTLSFGNNCLRCSYVANLLNNDIGANKFVTSFTIKTKLTAGKTATIADVGTVKIDSNGRLEFKPFNDTFAGKLPEIRYIINNSMGGDGKGANVYLSVFKEKPTTTYYNYPNGRIYHIFQIDGVVFLSYTDDAGVIQKVALYTLCECK